MEYRYVVEAARATMQLFVKSIIPTIGPCFTSHFFFLKKPTKNRVLSVLSSAPWLSWTHHSKFSNGEMFYLKTTELWLCALAM